MNNEGTVVRYDIEVFNVERHVWEPVVSGPELETLRTISGGMTALPRRIRKITTVTTVDVYTETV